MSGIAMGTKHSTSNLRRDALRGLMEMKLGISEIARRLGRHRAMIHREIERDRCVEGYRPDSAERRAWARKLRESPKFRAVA
jgi:IS30 family transposase